MTGVVVLGNGEHYRGLVTFEDHGWVYIVAKEYWVGEGKNVLDWGVGRQFYFPPNSVVKVEVSR